jgi:coenzyme F420-reducing hydrogenase delta subunit
LDIDGVSEVFLPCTGRVDLATALEALEQGAGGVLLVGCAESECRFPHPDGGCQAESIARRARRVVELLGMGADRISFRTLEAGASLRDVVEEGLAAAEGDAISSASTNEPSDETRGGGNVS